MDIDTPDRPSVPAYPYTYDIGKQLHAAASQQGDHGFGAFWAGSNVAQIRELEAADLINQLVLEMNFAWAAACFSTTIPLKIASSVFSIFFIKNWKLSIYFMQEQQEELQALPALVTIFKIIKKYLKIGILIFVIIM